MKPLPVRIGHVGNDLQTAEDRVADPERLRPGVHRHGVLVGAWDAEVIGRDSVADHQIIETDPEAVVADHFVLIMVDGDDSGAAEPNPFVPCGKEAKRVGDISGIEASGGNLIEQRLKSVVREPVDHRNPEPFLGQLVGRCNASEASADHHYMRHLSHTLI